MFGPWRKLLSMFIVLWALTDLTVPGVCQSDDLDSTPASTKITATYQPDAMTVAPSAPESSSSNQSVPEDCFCCCSHVAPAHYFQLAYEHASVIFESLDPAGQPRDFSPFLYHPPRA
jgi:hypothetical protein